jgi:hypothetical protein
VPRTEPRSDLLEDRPQDPALSLGELGLSSEPGDVAVGVPLLELPGVDDLLPLCQQEVLAELMTADGR